MRVRLRLRILAMAGMMTMAIAGAAMAVDKDNVVAHAPAASAVFAGGCFWCMQSEFDSQPGVLKTVAGFTGGHVDHPTYEQVSTGKTGHREAIEVLYDPKKVSYAKLLQVFWNNIDPLDAAGQFCDKGEQYKAAIFIGSAEEKAEAEASAKAMGKKLGKPVVTDILPRRTFWPAAEDHQEFYKRHAEAYQRYRQACGREQRLKALHGEK